MVMNRQTEGRIRERLVDGYVGTYYSRQSRGIYRFSFDPVNGRITEPELFYEAPNAKWVCYHGDSMVFPIEKDEGAGACFLKLRDGEVIQSEEILKERQTPCYILQDGDNVYTANYHEGNVMIYHLDKGKPSLVMRIENGARAGCHQILLHEAYFLVPCLEQNRIRMFDREDGYRPADDLVFPEGSGPRHGVFNRDHSKFYVVSEWSNQLFVFQVQGGAFTLRQTASVLPEGWTGKSEAAAAAIRLSKDERFLYISVRGADIISVFDVSGEEAVTIQHASCKGAHPRDFILSGNEKFLLVANRFQGGIASIERDKKTGLLKDLRHWAAMPECVSLTLRD